MPHPVTNCAVCSGTRFRSLFSAQDYHYGNPGEFTLDRCLDCGLGFLNPAFDGQELSRFYPDDYYSFQLRAAQPGLPGTSAAFGRMRAWARELLRMDWKTQDPHFSCPGKILDVGCGSGWFLEKMKSKGWEVTGVEPSDAAGKLGRSRGLRIITGTLEEAGLPSDHFDYVRANHSFEHMPDPNHALDEMRRLLRPKGKLLIGVPNFDGLVPRAFGKYWWHLAPPVHLHAFSPSTLRRLLKKHGFRVERVTHNSDLAGPLGSLVIWKNRHRAWNSSAGLTKSRFVILISHLVAKATDLARMGDAIEITAVKDA
jgi:SAM-dependent methyltransferase